MYCHILFFYQFDKVITMFRRFIIQGHCDISHGGFQFLPRYAFHFPYDDLFVFSSRRCMQSMQ